jgi:UDPglucose--hexose-1-phosphate uridylyltransferase
LGRRRPALLARWPFEIHLTPRRHVGWLSELTPGEADGLAAALRQVARTYDALFGFTLPHHGSSTSDPSTAVPGDSYHLHVEFYPLNRTATKLKHLAGSEAGAGRSSTTPPEETAVMLPRGLARRGLSVR